ncbi:MAG: 30S ribosomal protein S6 [Candidatus Magasanikbacteria bacterium]|nr:30S ribosomal protein S6 [Candidatus Magasanikbacteria bacterium]
MDNTVKYELLAVFPGTLDDAQVKTQSEALLEVVKMSGSDAEIHPLGKNRLAYPINHIRYGYFFTYVFSTEPALIKELEKKLALSRDLLRSLITHFNTTLTASQRIVYTTDSLGLTTMIEKPVAIPIPAAVSTLEAAPAEPVAKSSNERKLDEASMADITKKLDDLMKGDVISISP